MWCSRSPDILQNVTSAAIACSLPPDDPSICIAICPNADIAGVGVRSAFYVQSLMNTLLVIFSRRDSVPSTWAATLLTGALVIAAMVQKRNQSITLHHAIITMNFATLSCISSLVVAPTLAIWRLTPREYYAKRLSRDFLDDDEDSEHRMIGTAVNAIAGRHKRKIERAQNRQRLFLALALLTQVVLQWAWGVVLFVSPVYSQTSCSADTVLIFFLVRFTARDINRKYMVVWVLWLLMSLGITLFMTVVLALTSPARARLSALRFSPVSTVGTRSSVMTRSSASSAPRPIYKQMLISTMDAIPAWKDRSGQLIFWYNVLCIILWLVYIISSEIQIHANCIFYGENTITGFGQITALLLSLAPLWSLIAALYKWPEYQRKLERRRRREQGRLPLSQSIQSPGSPITFAILGPPHALDEEGPDMVQSKDDPDGKGSETTTVILEATPVDERAAPIPASVHEIWGSGREHRGRSRARRSWAHPREPTLDDVYLPRTPTEEWNELATFPRAQL